MINLRTKPGDRLLELGGGACPKVRPNADVRQCYDAQGNSTVDFVIDFEQPLPFADQEWDGIFSCFSFEHVSYTKIPQLLAETFRILKPGGKIVLVLPNTSAQLEWVIANPGGWDGKDFFTSASEILYGSQDYESNAHKSFFNPVIIAWLLQEAGFEQIHVDPYGSRDTDMVVQAVKPNVLGSNAVRVTTEKAQPVQPATTDGAAEAKPEQVVLTGLSREEIYNKDYFNGGGKLGGYKDRYWQFPCQEIVARHVLARRPETVLEIGAARGYVLRKLEDAGIRAEGLEISHHCLLTRASDNLIEWDICKTPWPIPDGHVDLLYSVATLEHIPEEFLPTVVSEMKRVAKRGLHGIDFGEYDNSLDQTRVTLKPREWWLERLPPNHEVFDKEELERGTLPPEVLIGDGKTKLALGTFIIMSHYGWTNIDVHDLGGFAAQQGYRYQRHDIRQGLPYPTGSVHLIHTSHLIEHFNSREGLAFLRECRRVLRPDGAIRLIAPDAELLTRSYLRGKLADFDEINDPASAEFTEAGKLWSLLFAGHAMAYDEATLLRMLQESGFTPYSAKFRQTSLGEPGRQILRECLDVLPCLSLYAEAVPSVC